VSGSLNTTSDWDGKAYDKLAAPQEEWARKVLKRLPLRGDETVLDAGCGSGRVTKLLLERLPEGRVIGVDGSPSMIETAAEAFAADDRVALINSDLLDLSPALLAEHAGLEAVDAVFSNATFHWIRDHERLFAGVFSVLRPGAPFVAQCGGRGNVAEWRTAVEAASLRQPFAEHIGDFRPWNFYGPEETAQRLSAAGFTNVETGLVEADPIFPEDRRGYVTVVGLAAHRDHLPGELYEPFADAVIEELPDPLVLRYVRLNIDARRPA
jgi:trans-aconitate 2-methyltransferase